MNRLHRTLSLTALVPLMLASFGSQGADEDNGDPVRCIRLNRLDRTDIIDERTIAFFMRGGGVYVNHLDRTCPRLDNSRPIAYSVPNGQLCLSDGIQVLEEGVFGLMPGAWCRLSTFDPSDEDAVAALKGELDEVDVTVEEVAVDDADVAVEVEEVEVER